MSDAEGLPERGREAAEQFVSSPPPVRLFVARELYSGQIQTYSWVTDEERETGGKEIELLAAGVAGVAAQTGRDRADVVDELLERLEEVPGP